VLPVFILDDVTPGPRWRWGGASRWWLHHSLTALRDGLGDLALFKGAPREILPAIVKEVGAAAVYWNRCYEPYAIARDKDLKVSLQKLGIEAQSVNGSLLHEPWEIATRAGSRFSVYTPYWRASLDKPVEAPLAAPRLMLAVPNTFGHRLNDWQLQSVRPNWAAIHAPFSAPPDVLAKAGVELGRTYPQPLVDHNRARKAALASYEQVRAAPARLN
jgi:deoxyribodipyrimidine photo-lyase